MCRQDSGRRSQNEPVGAGWKLHSNKISVKSVAEKIRRHDKKQHGFIFLIKSLNGVVHIFPRWHFTFPR